MPRLKTHNIDIEIVKKASKKISDDISQILNVDRSHVTIQVCEDKFIVDGEIKRSHPFVELALFNRPQELVDKIAISVTNTLKEAGCESIDLYQISLNPRQYYEDGAHF